MKSSHISPNGNLAKRLTPSRAEGLLQFWANLADPRSDDFSRDVESLVKSFPEVFRELRGLDESADSLGAGQEQEDFFHSVWGLREHLRAAWQATDLREREWCIYQLRRLYSQHTKAFAAPAVMAALESALNRSAPQDSQSESSSQIMKQSATVFWKYGKFWGFLVDPPPALTTFERLMFHFQRIAHRAQKCQNPECEAPFFFIKKKGQKFCKPECALPAQREAKREWWARNSKIQTKKRRQKRQAATARRRESGSAAS